MRPIPWLDLYVDTLRALLAPRRAVPIAVVALPMVWAQITLGGYVGEALLALVMVAVFVGVGPYSWRLLMPLHPTPRHRVGRVLVFAVVGVVATTSVTVGLTSLWAGHLHLTHHVEVDLVTVALFWGGAWGLGRDIDLEQHTTRLERAKAHAELMALRSHLDPHFLFNTLNAIAEWCRTDGEVAERAVLQLSDMLRTVLQGVSVDTWTLREELALLQTLFDLHLLRDPDLFELRQTLPTPMPDDVRVPPMVLLPLAENAMKHGPCAGHRGVVSLEARLDGDDLVVVLENPGAFAGRRDGGEGIAMVEKRLQLQMPPGAVHIGAVDEDTTRAEVRLPQSQRRER